MIICIGPVLYLTLFRSVDSVYCSKRIARNIGLGESVTGKDPYELIRTYIQSSLRKDMNRDEVFSALEKPGPFTLSTTTILLDGNTEDAISYRICYQVFNNPILYLIFTPGGTFLDVVYPDS